MHQLPAASPRSAALWLSAAVLAVALLAPAAGQGAGGLGMSPDRFAVAAAQPGETYQLAVLLQNRRGVDDSIAVSFDGEAGAWASTAPAGPIAIASGADREVVVRIAVPGGAGPGQRDGLVRFTGQPGPDPSGSGATVRPSVGLLLNVSVGGQAVVALTWLSARVEDAAAGQPVHAFVAVRNDGNVRATAEATGQVLPFAADGPVLAEADGSALVLPGETVEVPVTFAAGLAAGQYRARLGAADGSFERVVEFKVTEGGAAAPSGRLRTVEHEPRVRTGQPLRLDAWFENEGDVPIGQAVYRGELRRGGELVATIESAALAVPAGTHVNLTAYVTPTRPGAYTTVGQVTYDGYQTLPVETSFTAGGAGDGGWIWWWLLVVLVVVALLAILWAWRRGRRDLREGRPPAT